MMGTLVDNSSVPSSSPFLIWVLLAWFFDVADFYVIGLLSLMFVLNAADVCVIDFVPTAFFQGLLQGFGLLAGSQRGFSGDGIKYSNSSIAPWHDLFRIDLLAMRTWWVCKTYTLMCFVMSVYSMNILFHVLLMSDLNHFLAGMWVLALQLKI